MVSLFLPNQMTQDRKKQKNKEKQFSISIVSISSSVACHLVSFTSAIFKINMFSDT